MESKATEFDPAVYWSNHNRQPAVIASRTFGDDFKHPKPQATYNYYEDCTAGRQLSESIPDFLARLPPYSSKIGEIGPWIYIANPFLDQKVTNEDLRGFKDEGSRLLSTFAEKQLVLEQSEKLNSKTALGRKLNPLRKQLESDVYALARRKGVVSGKWMLFPQPLNVNRVWASIAQATADGGLGNAAKVAANDGAGDSRARLICIYTLDFADKEDVKTVLQCLDRMGELSPDKAIYYKADAFTHLEINSGNAWGLKPSLYGSRDVFKNEWER